MSHTPEPWELFFETSIGVRDSSNSSSHGEINFIAMAVKHDFENAKENAARIVDCVNFCAGADSDTLKNVRASELLSICGELLIRLTSMDNVSKRCAVILPSEQTELLIEKAEKLLEKCK